MLYVYYTELGKVSCIAFFSLTNRRTALHWAAKRNNMRIVEALIANGADLNLYTSKGELPCDLTTNEAIAKILGADFKKLKASGRESAMVRQQQHTKGGPAQHATRNSRQGKLWEVRDQRRHMQACVVVYTFYARNNSNELM